jgi:uncharacterized protein (TIGR02594 family)
MIPTQYKWLLNETGPRMIVEALKLVGIRETVGPTHNPVILGWAEALGAKGIYKTDETPWCGLAHAYVALKAGKEPLRGWDMLRALAWADWEQPSPCPMLGDTLVFTRPGGGHVGLYVGEDSQCYHVLGGNQSNAYGFARIAKGRLFSTRRPKYNVQPVNVRQIQLAATGAVSTDEK